MQILSRTEINFRFPFTLLLRFCAACVLQHLFKKMVIFLILSAKWFMV